jgi:uncharacterized membrane protein
LFTLVNPSNQCAGVNITVSVVTTSNVPCETDTASIIVTASGGAMPYTYSLSGGTYQSTNIFNYLTTSSYTITVKDVNGCTGSASTTVTNKPIGPLFAQVKNLIQYFCINCHGPNGASGGLDFSANCTIVTSKDRIKARAVDANPSPMPVNGLLSASERQKIIDWINAGGKFTN